MSRRMILEFPEFFVYQYIQLPDPRQDASAILCINRLFSTPHHNRSGILPD